MNIKNKTEEKIILEGLSTETRNQDTLNLDEITSLEIVQAMNKEKSKVPKVIKEKFPQIEIRVEILLQKP